MTPLRLEKTRSTPPLDKLTVAHPFIYQPTNGKRTSNVMKHAFFNYLIYLIHQSVPALAAAATQQLTNEFLFRCEPKVELLLGDHL